MARTKQTARKSKGTASAELKEAIAKKAAATAKGASAPNTKKASGYRKWVNLPGGGRKSVFVKGKRQLGTKRANRTTKADSVQALVDAYKAQPVPIRTKRKPIPKSSRGKKGSAFHRVSEGANKRKRKPIPTSSYGSSFHRAAEGAAKRQASLKGMVFKRATPVHKKEVTHANKGSCSGVWVAGHCRGNRKRKH